MPAHNLRPPVTRSAELRRLLADACHLALSATLWLGGTLLVTLGTILAVVILAADAKLPLLFAHLGNLASHYLAADAARRAEFDLQFVGLTGALALLFVLARLPAFAARMRRELSRKNEQ
ncbi:hypothetical protein [Sphingomonas sp.]|uniref:hypothetical protein n=1 Tax=Sphingomonas sp. TaxID=28214 RepID=UPI0035BC8F68